MKTLARIVFFVFPILFSFISHAQNQNTYTNEQAREGAALYATRCAACHGSNLEGGIAPALSGDIFRVTWSRPNVSLDDLHFLIRSTMPPQLGGSLSDTEYLNILAFILRGNGVAAGQSPLVSNRDYLLSIRMAEGGPDSLKRGPAFIEGERGLQPEGSGPTQQELLAAEENPQNWIYHTGSYTGKRYSALSQINKSNVGDLQVSCIYQVNDQGTFQTGPIVYDGTMYITGVQITAAIDAATCRQKWRHVWTRQDKPGFGRNRGVAIKEGYVVRGTDDGYLIALDSADGHLLWARQVANPWLGETFTMAPMIYDDLVLLGPAGSENAISGWVGAFRLSDGEEIWRFNTVPGATRSGGETWGNPEGIVLGGGAVWSPMTLDVALGELYVAITNPAPDLPANLRPGPNLYTNSIIALDVETGELNWYRQMVSSDAHDWDLTQVSPLFEATVQGQQRNLIATVGKDALMRVLDQGTHEILYQAEVGTRTNVDVPITEGTYACPGALGGVEWNGPALSPEAGVLITPAVNLCMTFTAAEEVRYVDGQNYMGGSIVPDLQSLGGWLTAVDARNGSRRWQYHSAAPMVAAVTTTAGGLVLTGETTGDFMVLDADSGEVLYRFNTGGPMGGGVISYTVDDKQYIAAASGSPSAFFNGLNPGARAIVVFSLRQ